MAVMLRVPPAQPEGRVPVHFYYLVQQHFQFLLTLNSDHTITVLRSDGFQTHPHGRWDAGRDHNDRDRIVSLVMRWNFEGDTERLKLHVFGEVLPFDITRRYGILAAQACNYGYYGVLIPMR